MNKLFLLVLLVCACVTCCANSLSIRINKNSRYSMLVNYQFCFLEVGRGHNADCEPKVRHLTIAQNQLYRDVKIDVGALFIRVLNAYSIEDGYIHKAYSEFGPEDCKSFTVSAVTLDDTKDNGEIVCVHTK